MANKNFHKNTPFRTKYLFEKEFVNFAILNVKYAGEIIPFRTFQYCLSNLKPYAIINVENWNFFNIKEVLRLGEKNMDKSKGKTETAAKGKLFKFIKGLSQKTRIIAVLVAVLIIGICVFILISQNKEGQVTTISESSLQKIIEIDELSTVDYTYNATATKYAEDNAEKVEYYVAYEGTVTAGIDFHEIDIDVNEEEKIVTFTIPEVEIHSIRVDMGKMDYIFIKDKFETETVSQEAYKLCKADLKKRIDKEDLIYNTAKENAISSVEALFKPLIETVDKEYKIVIK